MQTITVKYGGECRKCGAEIVVGSKAVHERRVGLFCPGCAPTDPEEIRHYRQEAADRKADKYEGWATKREQDANATLDSHRTITSDIAFCTQPGRIPFRDRINRQDDRAFESLHKAAEMHSKAENLRHVRLAGDAERRRQAKREALDKLIGKGSRVCDGVFSLGTVVSVHKKSYRIKFDSGGTYARDKSYVRPAKE